MKLLGNVVKPSVLVIGAFHGDEPQGEYLIEKYLEQVVGTNILFIPRLNSSYTRVNKNGVDLNRNFPTKNWVLSGRDDYFGGEFPASEKETQFVIKTVETFNPTVILTLHAPYKVVNYDGPRDKSRIDVVSEISKIMKYPIEESIGYPTPGSFGTWAGIEKQILTITLELDEEIEVSRLEAPVFKVFELLEGI